MPVVEKSDISLSLIDRLGKSCLLEQLSCSGFSNSAETELSLVGFCIAEMNNNNNKYIELR